MKKLILFFLLSVILLNSHLFAQQPEISVTTGHSTMVMKIALAPQGNLIASNSVDHLIKIWDKSSGKEITTLSNKDEGVGNEQRISSMKFFNDGNHLIVQDENGTIKVWNIKDEKVIHTFDAAVASPNLSYDILDNKLIFISKNYTISVADLNNLPVVNIPNLNVKVLKANPGNPNQVYVVDLENNNFIYDIEKNEKVIEFEKTDIYIFKATISNNGKHIAIEYSNMTIKIFDIKTGKIIKTITGMRPLGIDFHPVSDELMILNSDMSVNKNYIGIYDKKKFEIKRKIEDVGLYSYFMDISENGQYVAVNSMEMVNRSNSYSIKIIDYKSGLTVTKLRSRAHGVMQLVAGNNSPKIAALGSDMNLRIWNISTLQIEKVFPYIQRISINDKGNILTMLGFNTKAPGYNAISFWDMDSSKYMGFIPYNKLLTDLKFSADNEHIITAGITNEISVWNIHSKKEIISFKSSGNGNQKVHISPDLKYIAIGSSGIPGIKIYNTVSKETISIADAHPSIGASDLKFSSDGKYLYSGGFDQELSAWEVGTWKKTNSFSGTIGPISCVNLNSGNDLIASGTMGSTVIESDYAVNIWKSNESKPQCNLKGHVLAVNSIAFNFDDRFIYSGSNDGTIKIWDLKTCKEILSCISIDFDDYIFVTPDYYYSGSKDALKGVGFKMDGTKLYPFEQYDLRLNRPDILAERLNIAPANLIKAFKRAYIKRLEKMGYNENMLNEDFNIPQLTIKNKAEIAFQSNSKELSLDITANDQLYNLDRINIWINDVPLYGRNGIDIKGLNTKDISRKLNIKLSSGKNKIQISVLNSKGVESLKETVETIAPLQNKKPDLYIVAVGVSDYLNDDIDLNYAAKDAIDLTNIFENKKDIFDNINIIKVLDHQATKANILNTKTELEKTDINDLVIIYTAGHGFLDNNLDYFFATTDIDVYDPAKNGLAYDELESLLDNIPARKKLLMMDACHSGEIDYDEYDLHVENMSDNVVARSVYTSRTTRSNIGLDNSFRLMKELFADLRRGSGAIVISSAGGVEYAFESDKLQNGVFTYVLINALKLKKANSNADNTITISELQKYVMKTVSDLTRGHQNPTTRQENLEYDFVVW